MKKHKLLTFALCVSLAASSGITAHAEDAAGTISKADIQSESESPSESQIESGSESQSESQIESGSESQSESQSETQIESESESQIESESESQEELKESSAKDLLDEASYDNKQVFKFVKRMYEIVLEREPDGQGLKEWYDTLTAGTNTGADIMNGFFFSNEFQSNNYNNEEYILRLYRALFGREADSEGMNTWMTAFDDGVSRRFVCSGFLGSDEYRKMCASYGITPGSLTLSESRDQNLDVTRFVSHFYKYCLGRNGDPEGLNDWTGGLLEHRFDGAYIASGFIFSDEFRNNNLSDSDFIDVLYKTILGRTADASGKESWLKCINDGVSRHYILYGFINSKEFNDLCRTYGITRGNITLDEARDQSRELSAYITHLYSTCLERIPSPDELNAWADDLLTHRVIAKELASAFFTSDTYANKNTNDETYITDLYLALLHREPGSQEISNWINILKTNSRDYVLEQLLMSSEGRKLFTELGILIVRDGWIQEGSETYYYENGRRKSGWFTYEGQKYYLNPSKNGAKEIGWEYVDGYKLYFNNDGQLVQDVDYLIGPQDSYFIKVYKWANYVIIFAPDGNNGYTIPVKAMICSCGNNTPEGDYWTPNNFRWLTMVGGSKAQWCTQIIGSYLFHSVPYRIADNSTLYTDLMYNFLGTTQSLGCIRLQAGDAKWIYDNCSLGTHVNIDPYTNSGPFDKPAFEPLPSWHTWDPTDPTAAYLCQQYGCH